MRQKARLYRMRDGVNALLDRSGVTKAELARRSGVDRFVINDKVVEQKPARGVVAWKIARGYAAVTGVSEDEAFNRLWESVEDGVTQNITQAPSLTRAVTLF
jgi:hypothetical protein